MCDKQRSQVPEVYSGIFVVSLSDNPDYMICTSKDESVCLECKLSKDLNCRFDNDLVICFRNRHLPFRALAFIVVGITSYLAQIFWTFFLFVAVTILNFAVLETHYLCRHCPFYEKEGRTLECITLKGLPRLWKFDPSPSSRGDRIAMSLVGGFIDVFPLIVGAYATWVLFSTGAGLFLILLAAGLTIISLIAAGYLEKFIRENYCEKCVNLSCAMNKVPLNLREAYLEKNPEMRKIWAACGYDFSDS